VGIIASLLSPVKRSCQLEIVNSADVIGTVYK